MRVSRLVVRVWTRWAIVAAPLLGAAAACAADPGDSPKSAADDASSGSDVGLSSDTGGEAEGSSGGRDAPGVDVVNGSDGLAPETGSDVDAGNDTGIIDAGSDALTCLQNIPGNCPDCMTQNASDKPICEKYIQCFITNDCNPHMACGSNNGVCGVNTIGGGYAPYNAAVATYDCACP